MKRSLGSFVNYGYNNYHQQAVLETYGIIEKFENPTNTVKTIINENLKQRYQVYPKDVEALARVVYLLGKQGLVLRGHRESSHSSHNQDNYLTLFHEISHYYPLLTNHLEDSLCKDVKDLERKSQNELIDIIAEKLIQRRTIEEIIEAGVHSISADEVTTCNNEILSICLRYDNNDNKNCEVSMEFVDLERITGEVIGNAIIKFYNDISIEIAQCRGQCYDSAANMQFLEKRCSVIRS